MSEETQITHALCHSFPAELLLLLECVQQQPNSRQKDRIRAAADRDIDWTSFLRLSERHRVVPHAYLALRRSAVDLVPPSSMHALARRFQANTRKNLLVAGELARICRATNEAGIPLICFKGPALAMQTYGGLQCRQYKDVDLLVPPRYIVQAADLLNELGYIQPSAPLASLTPRQQNRLMKYYKHLTLTNPNHPSVVLELHWQLASSGQFAIAAQRLWDDSHRLTLGEGCFHVLPPQEQIVFLAWHGGMHRWKRLSWLFDLAQALRSAPSIEQTALLQTARALGVEKYMTLGLWLVRALTSGDLPVAGCGSPRVRRQMELSCRAMLADAMYYETKPLAGMFWTWRMSRKWSLRPEAVLHTFAPRIEHIHLQGPIAYLKRLQQLQSLTRQLVLSKLPGQHKCKSSNN